MKTPDVTALDVLRIYQCTWTTVGLLGDCRRLTRACHFPGDRSWGKLPDLSRAQLSHLLNGNSFPGGED